MSGKRGQQGRMKKLTAAEKEERAVKKSEARARRAHRKWADKKVMPGASG